MRYEGFVELTVWIQNSGLEPEGSVVVVTAGGAVMAVAAVTSDGVVVDRSIAGLCREGGGGG